MESVAPDALGMKLMRNCVVVRDRVVVAVKRGIEAGDLRKRRKVGQQRADRRQIMRLMQRRQRDEPLQPRHDAMIDQHRPVIVRTAMNDAMTDGHRD